MPFKELWGIIMLKLLEYWCQRVPTRRVQNFTQNLSHCLDAGIPLTNSIKFLEEQESNEFFKSILNTVCQNISRGLSFSDSLKGFEMVFGQYYRQLIHYGEESSSLILTLKELHHYQSLVLRFKEKLHRALIYPMVLLSMSLGFGFLLIFWIIPQFSSLFIHHESELPAITRILYQLSQMGAPLIFTWIFGFLILVTGGFYAAKKEPRIQSWMAELPLKIPLLSSWIQLVEITRWCRLMSTTLNSGMNLLKALKLSEEAFTHPTYKEKHFEILEYLQFGYNLSAALNEIAYFPLFITQLVALGEESGSLNAIFLKLAEYYESKLEASLLVIIQWLEPLILLLIAGITGILIIALYLPLFEIGQLIE